jgi:hypothetical protein
VKKVIVLVWVCLSLLAVSLTLAQAQVGFNLDFTGGAGDCVSWINGVGGGMLSATLSGGIDSILTTSNAGGASPECNFASFTTIYISLVGFTADSFVVRTTGNLDITLYSGGAGGTVVYSTSAGAGASGQIGTTYDTIYLFSYTGTDLDDIIIGLSAAASTIAGINPDPRLNVGDYGAPIAMYCTEGGGLDIYDIVGDEGVLAHRISDQVLANAIATAIDSGNNVRLINTSDVEVWALSSGEVQVNTGGYAYGFAYQSVCGALPEPDLTSSSEVEDEEDTLVIINRPR